MGGAKRALTYLQTGEAEWDMLVAEAERYELERRLVFLWSPLRCIPALLQWARRAKLKLDAPGQLNHMRYCQEYDQMAIGQ